MTNVKVVILMITPKLREAVSFFEEISLNIFFLQVCTEYTLIWPPKLDATTYLNQKRGLYVEIFQYIDHGSVSLITEYN